MSVTANYRQNTLLASESITTPGTKTIDITDVDPFSMIQVIHKATSAGTVMSDHIAANISKIELVDGSNVIASLTGKEAQALDYYHTGVFPYTFGCDVSGIMALATFNLNFGRWLYDPVLALDPGKYQNLQLKISHNYRACDAAASAASLEVYGFMFDDKKVTPSGYLRSTEHYSYTPGASGSVEPIPLPRDYDIRKALILAHAPAYYPWQVANHIKIKEENGKKVPVDVQTSAWLKYVNQLHPRVVEPVMLAANVTARNAYAAANNDIASLLMPQAVTNIVSLDAANMVNPLKFHITASDVVTGQIAGYNPHSAFPIPFGDDADLNDWYQVSKLGALNLDITAGAGGSSGGIAVVLEQLARY